MEHRAILAVSFGTSYRDTLAVTIQAIEEDLGRAFPGWEVRRAFTSKIVRKVLEKRDGMVVDSVSAALDRLLADGFTEVVVQPTHVISGYEYDEMAATLIEYRDRFERLSCGTPLLSGEEDYARVCRALLRETSGADTPETAIVWMGHGTGHAANSVYPKLDRILKESGHPNYFIGTVEAKPDLDDLIRQVRAYGAAKALLLPLMIVAGDHAKNDMAGDGEDSWKNCFQEAGIETDCRLKGLGEYPDIREIFVSHAKAAKRV